MLTCLTTCKCRNSWGILNRDQYSNPKSYSPWIEWVYVVFSFEWGIRNLLFRVVVRWLWSTLTCLLCILCSIMRLAWFLANRSDRSWYILTGQLPTGARTMLQCCTYNINFHMQNNMQLSPICLKVVKMGMTRAL